MFLGWAIKSQTEQGEREKLMHARISRTERIWCFSSFYVSVMCPAINAPGVGYLVEIVRIITSENYYQ